MPNRCCRCVTSPARTRIASWKLDHAKFLGIELLICECGVKDTLVAQDGEVVATFPGLTRDPQEFLAFLETPVRSS